MPTMLETRAMEAVARIPQEIAELREEVKQVRELLAYFSGETFLAERSSELLAALRAMRARKEDSP